MVLAAGRSASQGRSRQLLTVILAAKCNVAAADWSRIQAVLPHLPGRLFG